MGLVREIFDGDHTPNRRHIGRMQPDELAQADVIRRPYCGYNLKFKDIEPALIERASELVYAGVCDF